MTDPLAQPKSEALRAQYWREEILQVMFWIHGEGFGEDIEPSYLERFLGVDAAYGITYLDRMVDEGLLSKSGTHYRLTEQGRSQGGRIFADEFVELTKPNHGECGPTCWCRQSPDEAEACAADRFLNSGHDH